VLRRSLAVALVATLGAAPALAAPDGVVVPVPSTPTTAPAYVGAPAVAKPVRGVPRVPHNPHLAPDGDSSIHDDGWQSDTYRRPGPLGVSPQTLSASINGVCASIAFDRRGRIVTTCVGVTRALYLVDPTTLDVIDQLALPGLITDSAGSGTNPFQGFSGGAYFYLDRHDRAVIGAADGRFLVVKVRRDGLALKKQFDLSGLLRPGEVLNSGLPATDGLVWFVTKKNGGVGTLSLRTGRARMIRLGDGTDGQIENSIAVGSHGEAYVATNRRLYRFSHRRSGKPVVDWSVAYPSGGAVKPGQVDDGTGTTPTVLPGGYVAITDNADPMDVVVYRAAAHRQRHRLVCSVPVFGRGSSATENSLIGAGRSLIVENNYGYTGPASLLLGQTTKPGFARVDIRRHGRGCRLVWTSTAVSAPTVVPKLSLATGLVYAYTKPAGDLTDPWYWTALDYRTGRVVWQVLAGAGPAYNNNYAGLALGPDGTAYLGVIPGLIALRDG
jgi:hypothetical protein